MYGTHADADCLQQPIIHNLVMLARVLTHALTVTYRQ